MTSSTATIRRLGVWLSLLGALLLAACGAGTTPSGTPAASWAGAITQQPVPKPDVTLLDTGGHPINVARDSTGKVTLVYFGYTHCPDACPADMAAVANALKKLSAEERSHIVVYFVTTDPARDTGPVLRAFLDRFDSSFVGLTGSSADLLTAQRETGVTLAAADTPSPGHTDYAVSHAAYVLAYGSDGKAHEAFPGGVSVENEASDLRRLVAGETPA